MKLTRIRKSEKCISIRLNYYHQNVIDQTVVLVEKMAATIPRCFNLHQVTRGLQPASSDGDSLLWNFMGIHSVEQRIFPHFHTKWCFVERESEVEELQS